MFHAPLNLALAAALVLLPVGLACWWWATRHDAVPQPPFTDLLLLAPDDLSSLDDLPVPDLVVVIDPEVWASFTPAKQAAWDQAEMAYRAQAAPRTNP